MERVYRPDSVRRLPVVTVIPLDRRFKPPTRTLGGASCAAQAARVPIWCCSGWGFACRPCHQVRGGLLPHLFTLARDRLPGHVGGMFSVPLSVALGAILRSRLLRLAVNQHPARWSPDLPPGHLHAPATVRPAPASIVSGAWQLGPHRHRLQCPFGDDASPAGRHRWHILPVGETLLSEWPYLLRSSSNH